MLTIAVARSHEVLYIQYIEVSLSMRLYAVTHHPFVAHLSLVVYPQKSTGQSVNNISNHRAFGTVKFCVYGSFFILFFSVLILLSMRNETAVHPHPNYKCLLGHLRILAPPHHRHTSYYSAAFRSWVCNGNPRRRNNCRPKFWSWNLPAHNRGHTLQVAYKVSEDWESRAS